MSNNDTQLTTASCYNTNNMTFGKPKAGAIGPVQFLRIPIGTKNPDGSFGDLILAAPKLYSFGLSQNTNMQTGKPDGYTLPLCMYGRDGPTQEEKEFLTTFNAVVEKAGKHIQENRVVLKKFDFDDRDVRKLNPLWFKKNKDTGAVDETAGPVMYPKLIQHSKNKGKNDNEKTIATMFYDEKGRELDFSTLVEKPGYSTAAIKIEGIFIGAKTSIQVKVYEAVYTLLDQAPKRLLRPKIVEEIQGLPVSLQQQEVVKNNNDDESDSEEDNDTPPMSPKVQEQPKPEPPKPSEPEKKTTIRKIAAKK